MKKIGFLLLLISFILISCSSQGETDSASHNQAGAGQVDIEEGVQLALVNVGEDARPIFEKYFSHVEAAHEEMIYRQTERTRELFRQDRPDLNSAKLTYDGDTNHIFYTFYYTPNMNDLLAAPNAPMIVLNIGSYLYIQNMIRDYVLTVKSELQDQGIYLGGNPTVSYHFEAPDDAYLHVQLVGHEAVISVKNADDPTEYTIPGSFASGTLTLAVQNPMQTVQGENSSEARLIEFFGVTYEEFVDIVSHAEVAVEEEEVPVEVETPMDGAENLEVERDLEYRDEEYGFTLYLPATWKDRYAVNEGVWMENALKTIDFTLMDDGEPVSNIFSIVMMDMPEAEFRDYYGGGFVEFMTEKDGISIGYTITGEPPIELLGDESKQDLLNELMRMVNEDVPEIVEGVEY